MKAKALFLLSLAAAPALACNESIHAMYDQDAHAAAKVSDAKVVAIELQPNQRQATHELSASTTSIVELPSSKNAVSQVEPAATLLGRTKASFKALAMTASTSTKSIATVAKAKSQEWFGNPPVYDDDSQQARDARPVDRASLLQPVEVIDLNSQKTTITL